MTLTSYLIVGMVLLMPLLIEALSVNVLGASKKYFMGVAILLLLALNWAALHDIVKANQPSYTLEYACLMLSGVVLGILALNRFLAKARPRNA